MQIEITKPYNGFTVGKLLRCLGASGTLVKRMKKRTPGITVNGEHATVRYVLHEGDILFADDSDTYEDENPYLVPVDLPLDIVYEDNDVIVVNKPFGMPTHTSHGHLGDTLANALAAEYKKRGLPFVFRAVNRLDSDTSGCVMLAKSQLAASIMSGQMSDSMIKKRYYAILDGRVDCEIGKEYVLSSYIKRQSDSIITRVSMKENDGDGVLAITRYRVLDVCDRATLVEAMPETGRTHQLRVHFSSVLGHPIAGDDMYSGSLDLITRQALHAHSLDFEAQNGRKIHAEAGLPGDMKKLISELFHGDLKI